MKYTVIAILLTLTACGDVHELNERVVRERDYCVSQRMVPVETFSDWYGGIVIRCVLPKTEPSP